MRIPCQRGYRVADVTLTPTWIDHFRPYDVRFGKHDEMRLSGKVAIITGGGQGLGLAIAQAFAAEGAKLVISGRDQNKLDGVGGDLRERGAEVLVVSGDVRRRANANATVAEAIDRFGRIDVLVNNAQSSIPGVPLEDIDDATIALTLESGLLGTLYHMQAAFPHMKNTGGSIINLGSREGIFGGAGFGIYAATKEGIRGLSRSAAREWGKHGIRVNVLCPAALTRIAANYLASHPAEEALYKRDISLGRFGDPLGDVAPVAVFLASSDAKYLSGQTINADGGQQML